MAAAEGFSCKVKLPGITDLIKDSQPLFFPSGEQAASLVQLALESHYRAFYLPEVCSLPLGLVWPTTTGYEDFLASIQSLKSDYQHFVHVLEALKPQLTKWFAAIATNPIPFVIPCVSFLEVHDKGFPAVETGEFPDLIVDHQAFPLLQEMLHGYI
jgi:hypothetical protein